MAPEGFRAQFLSGVRALLPASTPADVWRSLAEWVDFDPTVLDRYALPEGPKHFLLVAGLPSSAAPYLAFRCFAAKQVEAHYERDVPRDVFPIGFNGAGDALGIENPSGAVVYFNHDDRMRRVFINSSIDQFAQTLILYQAHFPSEDRVGFLDKLRTLDVAAAADGAMWPAEWG